MTALGHSLQGRPRGKSSHVRCDAESGSQFRTLAATLAIERRGGQVFARAKRSRGIFNVALKFEASATLARCEALTEVAMTVMPSDPATANRLMHALGGIVIHFGEFEVALQAAIVAIHHGADERESGEGDREKQLPEDGLSKGTKYLRKSVKFDGMGPFAWGMVLSLRAAGSACARNASSCPNRKSAGTRCGAASAPAFADLLGGGKPQRIARPSHPTVETWKAGGQG
jgi:hypothetical protein